MFDDADLERLLQLCITLRGKFMLTMYPNETIRSYAYEHGWVIHSVDRQISACLAESRRKQEEWMVCNYEQPTQQTLNLFAV
jgi:DNA adenine methylase